MVAYAPVMYALLDDSSRAQAPPLNLTSRAELQLDTAWAPVGKPGRACIKYSKAIVKSCVCCRCCCRDLVTDYRQKKAAGLFEVRRLKTTKEIALHNNQLLQELPGQLQKAFEQFQRGGQPPAWWSEQLQQQPAGPRPTAAEQEQLAQQQTEQMLSKAAELEKEGVGGWQSWLLVACLTPAVCRADWPTYITDFNQVLKWAVPYSAKAASATLRSAVVGGCRHSHHVETHSTLTPGSPAAELCWAWRSWTSG